MNYQDIPFLIWSDDKKVGETIKTILGRKSNTVVESGPMEVVASYLSKSQVFHCLVFHMGNGKNQLDDLIEVSTKKGPASAIIIFSFKTVSLPEYQNLIRSGAADVLVYDESIEQVTLLEGLLRTLNLRWYLYRCMEREKKKMYEATVVTAYHEMNQALTVMINAIGLFKLEVEHESVDLPKLEKIADFILKGIQRIQEILEKLKKIKDPVLKEYTPGVAMVCLQSSSTLLKQEKSLEQIFNEEINPG